MELFSLITLCVVIQYSQSAEIWERDANAQCSLFKCFPKRNAVNNILDFLNGNKKTCEEIEEDKLNCIKSVFANEKVCDCKQDIISYAKALSYGTKETIEEQCTLGYVRQFRCDGATKQQYACMQELFDSTEQVWKDLTINESIEKIKRLITCID